MCANGQSAWVCAMVTKVCASGHTPEHRVCADHGQVCAMVSQHGFVLWSGV